MAKLICFNKPNRVLSQFSGGQGRPTLANYIDIPGVYPAGRLDFDSEGLLLLTDDGRLQARIAQPTFKMCKRYWAQLEGTITPGALEQLRRGIELKDGPARALIARKIGPPDLWAREPPVRRRKHIPTSWIDLGIDEGRNRQVRRMTAAVGFPTLRLVRWQIGDWSLGELKVGAYQIHTVQLARLPPRRH